MRFNKEFDDYINFDDLELQLSGLHIDIGVKKKRIKRAPEERKEIEAQIEKILKEDIPAVEALISTRPPAPELPPRKPLMKVVGIVEEIDVMKVVGYFQEREYDPEAFAEHEENEQVGALILAMIGNTAGSAVTSQSSVRVKSYCDFVRGKMNGKPFCGWVGKTNIQVGDYVEMAAMENDEGYVIYAIAHPERRTISVTPRCAKGLDGYIKNTRLYVRVFNFIVALIILVPLAIAGGLTLSILFISFVVYWVLEPIMYFISSKLERKNPKKNYVLAGLIFDTLGFKNPTEVDLIKITKEKIKSEGIPAKRNDPIWPDRQCTINYNYYY